ncbi:MAG: ATP-binding cassette domain-containing protein [Reichenbachiella sp.]|uniref:ATP-binding cassette domain-containing protein n=1 Tax=Reichenbachiella sp. TaxID=2184521 RepID=UPI002966BEAD|nr:ATP-binding cassette domain-containing protein [Reichenbachiella sp.]MDW3209484.1 ATP-binding cassette domain-containing protein [Reichenbachiella sp.]
MSDFTMQQINHLWNIKLSKAPERQPLIAGLLDKRYIENLQWLDGKKVEILSPKTILRFIDEELIHDNDAILKQSGQFLHSMSSGERKQAFLQYTLSLKPEVLVLDHLLDNLDMAARERITNQLEAQSKNFSIINIYSRDDDHLGFLKDSFLYENGAISKKEKQTQRSNTTKNEHPLPPPLHAVSEHDNPLVAFNQVSVSYLDKCILSNISWVINKGQFWHLYGPNGSGKTTLLTMITGDNPKAYGQDIKLFGKQKGTGETIWEIKQKVGYFTTNMTFQFKRRQTVRDMIISGFFDSVGLYHIASDQQIKLANAWLDFIGLAHLNEKPFIDLSMCHQRMIMIARAMVKHPPLLILDEASVDLDDESAAQMTDLINRIAHEGETTIIYVSHRLEPGLTPTNSFELIPGEEGSTGLMREI